MDIDWLCLLSALGTFLLIVIAVLFAIGGSVFVLWGCNKIWRKVFPEYTKAGRWLHEYSDRIIFGVVAIIIGVLLLCGTISAIHSIYVTNCTIQVGEVRKNGGIIEDPPCCEE